MSQRIQLGQVAHSSFVLYLDEVAGTRRSGAEGDVTTSLVRDGEASDEDVSIAEVDATGEYDGTFTAEEIGSYTVTFHDTVRGTDYAETFQVVDDAAASAVVVSATGLDAVRAGAAWLPVLVFLSRSTMTPVDPDEIASVEVLSALGVVLETLDGGDLERLALGRYRATPAVLASAGVVFLRVTFSYAGADVAPDVIRFMALPALGEAADVSGSALTLGRVYTSPSSLRAARFRLSTINEDGEETDLTDAEIWELIRGASAAVEGITRGNIFNGELAAYECTGRGTRVVYHPDQLPFCWLDTVVVGCDRTSHIRDGITRSWCDRLGDGDVTDVCVLRAGLVESVRRIFPDGVKNVTVTGAVGCLEPVGYATALSLSEIGADSNYVDVDETTGFQPRSVIDVVGDETAVRAIVTSIDRGLGRLFFDPLGGTFDAVEVGAIVRTFGQVPRNVETVTNYYCGLGLRELQANADGDEFGEPGRVKSEKTDNYQIEFMPGGGGGSTLTGNPRMDLLILPYMRAIDIRFI